MNFNNQLKSFFLASMAIGACTASLCKNGEVRMGEESSIWRKKDGMYSCKGEYKSEGFSQCKGDHTSIQLDMSKVQNKQACFAYSTAGVKEWDMQPGTTITFNAEWENCDKVWVAPIWLMGSSWDGPQGLTGEIDLMETCRGHGDETFTTSIICGDHYHPQCHEPHWGSAYKGDGFFRGKIDAGGTWTMDKCNLDGSNCELSSRYPNYLSLNHSSQKNEKFHFKSDLFNGGSGVNGDPGWNGCGTLNLDTNCKYTVTDIQVGVGTPDPAPSPSPSSGVCNTWCAGDTANRSQGRHCGGDMDNLCGGCPYCVCNDWCAADRTSEQGRESRHCGGDMVGLCGGCSYCHSSNSARSEL